MINPIRGMKPQMFPAGDVTQVFGVNKALYAFMGMEGHNGVDYVRPHGSAMFAVEDGIVLDVKFDRGGFGRHVRFLSTAKDEKGYQREWTYGHCDVIMVKTGDRVAAGHHIATMGNCFDKETEILTDEGWKLFSDLNKRELVATLNPTNGRVEYHKPVSYTKKIEKTMWQFKNYHSLDMMVTGNHTMYVEKQDGKMHLINFQDLPDYSWVKQSGGVWGGVEVDEFLLSGIEFRTNKHSATFTENIPIPMDSWLAFLGWFLTDGYVNGTTTRITQSFNNSDKRVLIENILDELPFESKRYAEDYLIHSKQLTDYLRKSSPNKCIPSWIGELSPRQIRIFLDAFHGGDGWYHKSTKYYITPDKNSADVLQELIMKCGGYATIKKHDPTTIKRTKPAMIGDQEVISKNPYYVITEGKHRMGMIRKKEALEVEYNDYAYCLTVQNHIIYVRRNGRPMWCGNTGFVVSGATPFWKNNPYAGTHLHLGVRLMKVRTRGGWSYPKSDIKLDVINYNNGFKGCIDPAPYLVGATDLPVATVLKEMQLTLMSLLSTVLSSLQSKK